MRAGAALDAAGCLPVRVKSPVNGGQDGIELFEVLGAIDVQVALVTFFIHRSNLLAAPRMYIRAPLAKGHV